MSAVEAAAAGRQAAALSCEITVFTKPDGLMTKIIALDSDGMVHSDGGACALSYGTAERVTVASAGALAALIGRLQPNQAIALGRLRMDLSAKVPVVTKRNLKETPDAIARTGDYINFAPGIPAFAPLDIDLKGMPPEVRTRVDAAGGVWNALCGVLRGLAGTAHVSRASTSSAIWRTDTDPPRPMPGSGGQHFYITVADGADVPRFLDVFADRCWLNGFGWMMIGKAGQMLKRSLVDACVGRPEHLVFEGGPHVVPPLAQDQRARAPVPADGMLLDSAAACPPLFAEQHAVLRELQAKERQRLQPVAAEARAAFEECRAREIARHQGRSEASPADWRAATRACEGYLSSAFPLPFDDPELVGRTVADVLADPVRFEGETMADPLEGVQHGRCKAMVMLRSDGRPVLHSFAHGTTMYSLYHDAEAVRAALEKTRRDQVVTAFAAFRIAADLAPGEYAEIRERVATLSGAGLRVIDAAVKEARQAHDDRRAKEKREREAALRRDQRPQVPLPSPGAERLPIMQMMDRIMSVGPTPALRNMYGAPVYITCRSPVGLHLFGATDTPAPEMPLLTAHDTVTLEHEIERFVEFATPTKAGGLRPAALHDCLVESYRKYADSTCPRVGSVVTLPLVLPDGTLHAPDGLDREFCVVFRVDPALLGQVAAPGRLHGRCGKEGDGLPGRRLAGRCRDRFPGQVHSDRVVPLHYRARTAAGAPVLRPLRRTAEGRKDDGGDDGHRRRDGMQGPGRGVVERSERAAQVAVQHLP